MGYEEADDRRLTSSLNKNTKSVGFEFAEDNRTTVNNGRTAGPVNDGDWHHVCFVRDTERGEYYLYLDGDRVDTDIETQTGTATLGPLHIGSRNTNNFSIRPPSYFHGLLDDFRIYSRALSEEEIAEINGGAPVADLDQDGRADSDDNCPNIPNGPSKGSCIYGDEALMYSYCTSDEDCEEYDIMGLGTCSMNQEDVDGDGYGDACDWCVYKFNPNQNNVCSETKSLCDYVGGKYVARFPTLATWKRVEVDVGGDGCVGRCGKGCPQEGGLDDTVECWPLNNGALVYTDDCLSHDVCIHYKALGYLDPICGLILNDAKDDCDETACFDDDGDRVSGEYDYCPDQNASGKDANQDGCTDPRYLLEDLAQTIVGMELQPTGIQRSLIAKIDEAIAALWSRDYTTALVKLHDLINFTNAQRGKKIPEEDADIIIADAEVIIARILADAELII